MNNRNFVSQHIVKHNSGGWALKKGGALKASKIFKTQAQAYSFGRQVAINQGAELFVHGRNGRIRQRNSYGRDFFPPQG